MNHCIICYKGLCIPDPTKQYEKDSSSKSRGKFEMFFKLSERYLKDPGDKCFQPFPVWENIFDAGIPISCVACQGVMESFCELFHQMKSIELLIHWKLWTLKNKNIMYSAERVPSRLNEFKEAFIQMKVGNGSNVEQLKMILNFKHALIRKCQRKLLTTFPRLQLVKFHQVKIDEPPQLPAIVDDCVNGGITSMSNSMTVPIQVTGNKDIPLNPSSKTLEVEDTSLIDQVIEEPVAANVHIEPTHFSSVPNDLSKTSQMCSRKKKRRKTKRNLLRFRRGTILKKMRKRTLASRKASNLRKAITTGGKSSSNSVNAVEETIHFNDCVPESPEGCVDAEVEMDIIEKSLFIPPSEDLITDGEPVRHGRPKTMDDSATGNVILQATETSLSTPPQCLPAPLPRNSVDEVELDQTIIDNSKYIKTEANPKNNSDQEVVSSVECIPPTNFEEVPGCSDITSPNTRDVIATTPPLTELEESVRTEAEESKESSKSRLRSVHRCVKCMKTFSTLERLLEHQRSHEKEKYSDSKSDENSASETENSESDFNCNAVDDIEDDNESEDSESEEDMNLTSKTSRPFMANSDLIQLNGSESDDSEAEYYNDDEINVEEDFNQEAREKTPDDKGFRNESDSLELNPPTENGQTCNICKSTVPWGYLKKHFNSHHNLKNLSSSDVKKCAQTGCSAYFLTFFQLRTHERKAHGIAKQYKCVDCNTTYKTANSLRSHDRQKHWHELNIVCSFKDCDNRFRTEELLEGHIKIIHEQKLELIKCPTCEKKCWGESNLHVHLKSHSSVREVRNDKCNVCKSTVSRDHMKQHFNSHHNPKNLSGSDVKKCAQTGCSASFLTFFQLRTHERNVHAIAKQYKCVDCNITYKSSHGLSAHYQLKHSHELNYNCSFEDCDRRFKTEELLEGHIKVVHEQKLELIKCPTCEKKCWGKTNLQKHLKSHSSEFHCNVENCKEKLTSKEDYDNHQKLHGKFTCFYCDVTRDYALELAEHEVKEHSQFSGKDQCSDDKGLKRGSTLFTCPRPNCSFRSRIEDKYIHHFLVDHLKLQPTDKTTQECTICKLTIKMYRPRDMTKHYDTHHNFKNLTGSECKKCVQPGCAAYFLSSRQLQIHEARAHAIKKRYRLKCAACNLGFNRYRDLRNHCRKKHVNQLNYVCTVEDCGDKFITKQLLDSHTKIIHRRNLQLIKCPKCEKSFWGEHYLKQHLRSHSYVRKASNKCICEQCGKVFKDKEKLKIHNLSHSGPDSWKSECSVCSKKCINQHKLDEHMRTHTKEKPFVCEVCGIKYAHRHNLRIHVNSKHGKVTQDKPRKFNKVNMSSRKGIKRKKVEEESLSESSFGNSESDSDDY